MKQKTGSLDPHQYPPINLYFNNVKNETKIKSQLIQRHPTMCSKLKSEFVKGNRK